jgi:hypothetical protein
VSGSRPPVVVSVAAGRGADCWPSRRVAKLYPPPGGKYFGNRDAYGLTYTSCQDSGKYDGLYRRLAAHMGTDPSSIRLALKGL